MKLPSTNLTGRKVPVLVFAVLVAIVSTFLLPTSPVHAVDGGDWRAGNIIDDGLFYNNSDMSAGDIQNFLNSKVPSCDTNGTKTYSGSQTRAQYGASRGYPAPYTCLKDYSQNGASAAQIIKNAADTYSINPKTLLVLLQKEQTLVTDDWPWPSQYRSATGYGCPDTAPCDAEYYGFANQVSKAAFQFRRYATYSNDYRYKPYQSNYIQYNPNTGCGGTDVVIENKATAGLYNYTPYQPNASALSNLYGTGDGCGAYGNRNFWRLFNDWFGSTHAPSYGWSVVSQYAYTDASKTTPAALDNLAPGQRAFVGVTVRNNGYVTWSNSGPNPIDLGTTRPEARDSPFFDDTWLGQNRPARMKEASVAPGQTATFEFWMKAPANRSGNTKEYFTLVAEGQAWLPDVGLYFNMNIQQPNYSWQLLTQDAYTDDTKSLGRSLINLEPGERVYVGFTARNNGNVTWTNSGPNPVDLGISQPTDRYSPFFDDTWLGQNRPARMKEASVAPGQTATFEFWMKAPANRSGAIYEYFNLVSEGVTWMPDIGLNFYTTIVKPRLTWEAVTQYVYTDANKTTATTLGNLSPGQVVLVGFTARNTGNFTWHNSGPYPIRVGSSSPTDRISQFCHSSWLGCNRPTALREASVAPGQVGTFEFLYKAPSNTGTYKEYFDLLYERIDWMTDIGMNYNAVVR